MIVNEDIKYLDIKHREFFLDTLHRLPEEKQDIYHLSFFYLIGLTEETRVHSKDCFDYDNYEIIPGALTKAWHTSTSHKTTSLAFNLFNDFIYNINDDGTTDMDSVSYHYTVSNIFNSDLGPYFFEAIKIRYDYY